MTSETNILEGDELTSVRTDRKRNLALATVFGSIVVLAAVDLVSDVGSGASWSHWALEGLVFVIALTGLAAMVRTLIRTSAAAERLGQERAALDQQLSVAEDQAEELAAQLASKAAEAEQWRDEAQQLLAGLGEAIARQFDRWELTNAEKEVALLLLKGLSHKEVADVRGTSDATTRQQARAIYKKAGLSGRNDLSAFFLEDLLLPVEEQLEA